MKENTDDIIRDTKINLKKCLVDSVHVKMMKTMAISLSFEKGDGYGLKFSLPPNLPPANLPPVVI